MYILYIVYYIRLLTQMEYWGFGDAIQIFPFYKEPPKVLMILICTSLNFVLFSQIHNRQGQNNNNDSNVVSEASL